jgi:hypothetical protein
VSPAAATLIYRLLSFQVHGKSKKERGGIDRERERKKEREKRERERESKVIRGGREKSGKILLPQ